MHSTHTVLNSLTTTLREITLKRTLTAATDLHIDSSSMLNNPVEQMKTASPRCSKSSIVNKKTNEKKDIVKVEQRPQSSLTLLGFSVSFHIPFEELSFDAKPISYGHYGTVHKGEWKGMEVAVKHLKPPFVNLEKFKQESKFLEELQKLNLTGVVEYAGFAENPRCDSYNMVFEYLPQGDVFAFLVSETAPNNSAVILFKILKHTIDTIMKLHQKRIVHADLKWDNVMLKNDYEIKLIDFGFSFKLGNNEKTITRKCCYGTPRFRAPELINSKQFSSATDMFAFGTMMYMMFERKSIFYELTEVVVEENISKGIMPDSFTRSPPKISELIKLCWKTEPEKRPSAKQVYEEITLLAEATTQTTLKK